MGPVATDVLVASLVGASDDFSRIVGETLSQAGAAPVLIAELTDRSADRRRMAIQALGAMRSSEAVEAPDRSTSRPGRDRAG